MRKAIVACLLLSASVGGFAQDKPQRFTSEDGTYRFTYPAYFVRCSQETTTDQWQPADCEGMIPLCPRRENTANAACVAYPRDRYKDFREFEAAIFSAAVLLDRKTEESCLKGWDPTPNAQKGNATVVIHGTRFKVFEDGFSAAGTTADTHIYLAFHKGECYELVTGVDFVSTGLEEPYKHLSKSDWERLDKTLWQVAETFRFLK